MGGKGDTGSAPLPPDYAGLAQLQSKIDRAAATSQTRADRPDQYNNLGNVTWEEKSSFTPEQQARMDALRKSISGATIYDQYGGKTAAWQKELNDIKNDPRRTWTQTETLDPRIKAQQDAIIAAGGRQTDIINQQGAFDAPESIQWNPDAMKEYGDAIYGSVMDRARPEQERQMAAFTTSLRQQGLQPGTAAYDRAMQNLMTSQGDVNTQAAHQATIASKDQYRNDYNAQIKGQDQAYSQYQNQYEMPWKMSQAAQGQAQGYSPNFQGYSGATGYNGSQMAQAGQAQYEANMGQYNAKQQAAGAK